MPCATNPTTHHLCVVFVGRCCCGRVGCGCLWAVVGGLLMLGCCCWEGGLRWRVVLLVGCSVVVEVDKVVVIVYC